jgi:23S rRNA (pseudouridine1915-N3)-methyltransferase
VRWAWGRPEHEVEDRKNAGAEAEAALLARAVPPGALLCILDERGQTATSPEFAALLAKWRDAGRQDLAFAIGGADGLAPAFAPAPTMRSASGRWSGRICWCG